MSQHTIKSELKSIISLGTPLLLSQSMYACSPSIATAMVARLGEDALVANVLVYSAYMALTVLFVAMLNAVGVLVSHQYGAKNEKAISEIMGQAFLLGAVICVLVMVVLACAPYFLSWHTQPLRVVQLAHELLRLLLWTIPGLIGGSLIQQCLATQFFWILSIFLLIESVRLIMGFGALRGLKDAHFMMLTSLFVFWIMGLTTSFLLAFVFHLSGRGLWWGLTFAIALGTVAVIIRWYYLMRRIDLADLVKVENK